MSSPEQVNIGPSKACKTLVPFLKYEHLTFYINNTPQLLFMIRKYDKIVMITWNFMFCLIFSDLNRDS